MMNGSQTNKDLDKYNNKKIMQKIIKNYNKLNATTTTTITTTIIFFDAVAFRKRKGDRKSEPYHHSFGFQIE